MLNRIPQNRLILYILVLGLLPFALVFLNVSSKRRQVDDVETTLRMAQQKALSFEKKQAKNIAIRNYYRNADRFYIDKCLETLSFLQPEIENLEKIVQNKNFTNDKAIEKRLEFLSGPSNRLTFVEGVVQTYPYFQETTETLAHPVEVNVEDIKKILARTEGIKIGDQEPCPNPPQLSILEFKLDKKTEKGKSDVYSLNLKLLKREFT